MPRKTSDELVLRLITYVRAAQFNSAQDVIVGFRECSTLTGIPYSTVKYHLKPFTIRKVLNIEAFFAAYHAPLSDNQNQLNKAVMKWREGRACTHAACRCRYFMARKKLREKGATLQEEARWLSSASKKSRRSFA